MMKILFSLVSISLLNAAHGQPVTATGAGATAVAQLLFPPQSGVLIQSATAGGQPEQVGVYTKDKSVFKGLASTGAILSSGNVANVAIGSDDSKAFGGPGDAQLDLLLGGNYDTADAASLLIAIRVPVAVTITWRFVFGSNDYPLFFGTPDLFGFFLNGVNVAMIGNDPISTYAVNCGPSGDGVGPNCKQYVKNDGLDEAGTGLNGYTLTQTLTLNLPIGDHTIKIAIADAEEFADVPVSDTNDSMVLLSFRRAVQVPAPVPVPVAPPKGKMMGDMMMMGTNR
jgi:hypothetical protein